MIFEIINLYYKIKNWVSTHGLVSLVKRESKRKEENKHTVPSMEQQEKQILWIRDNVKFYPVSHTTVYHRDSAYDIWQACQKYQLDYHIAQRIFTVAVRWNSSYLDAAEMIHHVDTAQS